PALTSSHLAFASLPRPESDSSQMRETLLALGRLWLGGLRPDFVAFVQRERRRRITLPAYPFERRPYWLRAPAPPSPPTRRPPRVPPEPGCRPGQASRRNGSAMRHGNSGR